jgi:hypothetical protein
MTTSEINGSARVATMVPAVTDRDVTTPREDLVTTVLAAVMVGGVLTDSWAHVNILDTIESFFTPWHAMLYTGFAAVAAWTFWLAFRRRPTMPRWWRTGWPVGYLIGAIGAVGFAVGGLLDMVWHTIFGVETSLDISFSPSHLLLSLSATLLLSSPVRSWWATGEGGLRAVSGVLSLGFATVFGGILLTTFSAFTSTAPTRPYDYVNGSASHVSTALGMACYVITTVLLVVPVLLSHRRRPAPGTATGVVAIVALFACTMYDLAPTQTAAGAGAIVGAVIADVVLYRLDVTRGRDAWLRLPIAGAVLGGLVWAGHLLGMHLATGLRWPVELWAGTVVVTALVGAGLGMLAERPIPSASARV